MKCLECENQAEFTKVATTWTCLTYENGKLVNEEIPEAGGETEEIFCSGCHSSNVETDPDTEKEKSNA